MADKVSITTLGCRSNQYDSTALEEMVRGSRFETVPFPGPADAYIINTCTVTAKTDYQSRQQIRRARRVNPDAVIIVTGCYAQVSPGEVARIEGVDYILGNPEKGKIIEYIKKGRQSEGPLMAVGPYEPGTPISLRAATSYNRTRVNLKVQDGCNRRCTFCIVPMARGRSKSLPTHEVINEIDVLVGKNFKEIVFTGIHLGAYGADLSPHTSIVNLLKEIEKKGYPCRFRISSIDPDEVTDELIELIKGAKTVCNHLHLPLQSGDNSVLKRMRRPYSSEFFANRVEKLVKSVPGISIGVDVIAGFPGEGTEEFENTYSLIRDLSISYLHIFPYSKRRGTLAAGYTDQVDGKTIKQRCSRLKELDRFKREDFYKGFVGRTAKVIIESKRDTLTGMPKGRTRNYIPVVIENGEGWDVFLSGEIEVHLIEASSMGMVGRL
jgi:threonylcarbamoyladenosine tRNA methylthiotransferase MtaB